MLVEDRHAAPPRPPAAASTSMPGSNRFPVRHRRLAQFLSLGNHTSEAAKKFKVLGRPHQPASPRAGRELGRFVGDDELALPLWPRSRGGQYPADSSPGGVPIWSEKPVAILPTGKITMVFLWGAAPYLWLLKWQRPTVY